MSRNLRRQVVLSFFLAATVAALHRSPTRSDASNAAAKRDAAKPASGSSHDAPLAATALAGRMRKYSDAGSASERRRMIVDQLRALGVPNDVLALVAMEDFEVEWDGRLARAGGNQATMERLQLEKDMSKDAAMRAALGAEGFKQWDTKTMLWEAMSTAVDVTPVEAESIYALKKRLQQRQFDLEQAQMNGTMDRAGVIEAIKKSYADYDRDLKAVLGEERYAKSQQLDDEFVAGNLRYELAKVSPSDAQFQELLKTEQDWNKSFAALDQSSPDYLEKFKALNAARDQEYEQVLGAAAFRSLREQEDASFIQMKKYETYWGLDDGKIDHVYDAMNQYRKAVGDYQIQVQALQQQGQDVDWASVNNYLKQLAGQTQQALQNVVGPDSFSRLQRNGILRWAGAGFRPVYGATVSP